MDLNQFAQPKGAYYTPTLTATFSRMADAEAALEALQALGFTPRDIGVSVSQDHVTVVVSEPASGLGLLEQAQAALAASAAQDVHPYGAGGDDGL